MIIVFSARLRPLFCIISVSGGYPERNGRPPRSERSPAGKHKAALSIQTQHRQNFMRTHRLESALAKEEGSGYNRPVVQLRCCAEWCGHSYRAVGCCYHPAACRNYVSDTSILPDVKTNCKTFPAFPVKIPVRLPADGDLPFLGIPPASAARRMALR